MASKLSLSNCGKIGGKKSRASKSNSKNSKNNNNSKSNKNKKSKNKNKKSTVLNKSENDLDYGISSDEEEEEYDEEELTPMQIMKERYEYKPLVRREITNLEATNRITSEIMTKFEYARVIAIRAKQLEKGGLAFTEIGNITDYKKIAEKEVYDKKCPLDLIRYVSDNVIERWHVNEMGIPND